MSILDGLRDPGAEAVGLGGYVHKNAVREALTSPTDEQVAALADVAWNALTEDTESEQMEHAVRAVLAAAAGGER